MKKLWSEGTSETNSKVFHFTVGKDYLMDQLLLPYDLRGSQAHAKMLAKIGILSQSELDDMIQALAEIKEEYDKGNIQLTPDDEDMHSFIERALVEKLGNTGKKIHTGRSRNDQVLTALRLYYKDRVEKILQQSDHMTHALKTFIKKYGAIEIAGYTHMRKAMPSSIAMWAGAFWESMEDNKKVLEFVKDHIDQSPLGSGAGYGVPLKLDREFTAKELGFSKVQHNPIYIQNSRGKFESFLIDV